MNKSVSDKKDGAESPLPGINERLGTVDSFQHINLSTESVSFPSYSRLVRPFWPWVVLADFLGQLFQPEFR